LVSLKWPILQTRQLLETTVHTTPRLLRISHRKCSRVTQRLLMVRLLLPPLTCCEMCFTTLTIFQYTGMELSCKSPPHLTDTSTTLTPLQRRRIRILLPTSHKRLRQVRNDSPRGRRRARGHDPWCPSWSCRLRTHDCYEVRFIHRFPWVRPLTSHIEAPQTSTAPTPANQQRNLSSSTVPAASASPLLTFTMLANLSLMTCLPIGRRLGQRASSRQAMQATSWTLCRTVSSQILVRTLDRLAETDGLDRAWLKWERMSWRHRKSSNKGLLL
jgi:hypothetical protein